jgi:thymidylate kinase
VTEEVAEGKAPATRLTEAIGALARAGLLASGERLGRTGSRDEARVRLVGQPWAAARRILAGIGFAEVNAQGSRSRTYATYDLDADRWLLLGLDSAGPADIPGTAEHGERPATARSTQPRSGRGRGPGMVVALLGPDGAGKSTLMATVARSFVLPVRQFYAGLYPADRRRFKQPGLGTVALLLRLWRLAIGASWNRRRGRLVLFDRYAYDARLPLPPTAGRRTRTRRALLARSLPTPDLVVVLDAPAEVLLGRKKEHALEVVEAQRRRYAELARSVPDGVIVDVSADADSVRRVVTALIWDRYVTREVRRDR